jgi:hypothetical protein
MKMNGLYKKKTKKATKLVKDYNFGYVKKKEYIFFIIACLIIFLLSIGVSELIRNLLF